MRPVHEQPGLPSSKSISTSCNHTQKEKERFRTDPRLGGDKSRNDVNNCIVRLLTQTSSLAYNCYLNLMNVPFRYSSNAIRSSSSVFITIGPYQATGSLMGLPDMSRKRTGSPCAATVT